MTSDHASTAAHGQHHEPVVLMPSLTPPQLPPGYGCVSVDVSRGPYLVPATAGAKLKIGDQKLPVALSAGRWYVPVRAGVHGMKLTDVFGIPMITTTVTVAPGETHHRHFHFGVWRNRARDAAGADVTRFGMWSNYLIGLIAAGATAALCCGGFVVVALPALAGG